jgi:DNA-binding transcriptional regulator PaaX
MTDSLRTAIIRELERAYPGPITFRSLRSLVSDGVYTREEIQDALFRLEHEGRITEHRQKGMRRYRLSDRTTRP